MTYSINWPITVRSAVPEIIMTLSHRPVARTFMAAGSALDSSDLLINLTSTSSIPVCRHPDRVVIFHRRHFAGQFYRPTTAFVDRFSES